MLQIKNVTYGYSALRNVVENFSLEFSEPGVYGLLGKNGTGKSTLLYLIMGLLRPKNGEITFCGIDTKERRPEALSEMLIVPEEYDLPSTTLPQYVKAIKPFYPNFSSELMVELLQVFDMTNTNGAEADKDGIPMIKLDALSMGQKKKIYMCIALAARTKLLVMDEPTNGLDIPSKSQFRKVVAKGMRDDQIVLISTHQVKDVEQLLDHVTIIDNNAVLVNEAINMDEPLDLEEMFIKAIGG
ncbi:MAG: ABC transporter ATP-binding protein [Prevotellaceae bacterium]|nr:ABC transporter ATP-binding protein [Candidatus Minthosoma caballi]